ncbi:hypothetical protein L1987_60571 [Smallanthus sonchifolius]|uniref:Uncharacterized protein n=1 Tax=Smallanthus sonchifolius TaxID=185202 RepID=A0ACB9D8T3_9ASTR|nr:hypothetical protein L1987_60571 [Smallanthus sonchifolius]
MFWRLTGLSTVSPVDAILDKRSFTLEELLDEDEIIQECRAVNSRLVNFLRERTQVEQLVRYIVEEAPEDAVKQRAFKFPFIACEIFTCEVDIILKSLVEDEELMNLLFSFLEPEHPHSTLLAGYFSKVVVCLLLRKPAPLMSYIQAHPDIILKLIDLIGITSIMEVLIRLIGADKYLYTNYADSMQWLQDIVVLEMIVNKFSSSDRPEVHANVAEIVCARIRNAPPGLAAKISSPSFVARLFHHAMDDSRPKSVLVYSLAVCISLLNPNKLTSGTYYVYNQQLTYESAIKPNPETVKSMLESLGYLLKLLDLSADENVLPTTFGKLQPPLGKHRLKIVEFISVLMTVGSEAAEKELIRLGVLRSILELFFAYPYNNFLHHHIAQIIVSCLESKNASMVEHILDDCNLVRNIIDAKRNSELNTDKNNFMPSVAAEGRMPPRVGNVGYMTLIANKLVQLKVHNSYIHAHLQDNSEWVQWHADVLMSRNALGNVLDWECGRPTTFHDQTRYSDDDDYQDRDYDVAALANNLSQAFRYGVYENDINNEVHGSLERDNEDIYFDDESAEAVVSLPQLRDDQESGSRLPSSSWFDCEEENTVELSNDAAVSPSPNTEGISEGNDGGIHTATSELPDSKPTSTDTNVNNLTDDSNPTSTDIPVGDSADHLKANVIDNPPESIDSVEPSDIVTEPAGPSLPVPTKFPPEPCT